MRIGDQEWRLGTQGEMRCSGVPVAVGAADWAVDKEAKSRRKTRVFKTVIGKRSISGGDAGS